jgi:hypothetical protein
LSSLISRTLLLIGLGTTLEDHENSEASLPRDLSIGRLRVSAALQKRRNGGRSKREMGNTTEYVPPRIAIVCFVVRYFAKVQFRADSSMAGRPMSELACCSPMKLYFCKDGPGDGSPSKTLGQLAHKRSASTMLCPRSISAPHQPGDR